MSILKIIIRKFVKNKWLYSCLLFGLVISVALISSIPLYTEGILNRLLVKELENSQINSGRYPGNYSVSYMADEDGILDTIKTIQQDQASLFQNEKILKYYKERYDTFKSLDTNVRSSESKNMNLPSLASNELLSTDSKKLAALEPNDNAVKDNTFAYLQSLSDIEKHVKIIDGRLPAKSSIDGVYEVMVTSTALSSLDLLLDHTYSLSDIRKGGFETIKVKPVGVFSIKDEKDPYWVDLDPNAYFNDSFLINDQLMMSDFIDKSPTMIKKARWNYIFDYHSITIDKLNNIVAGFRKSTDDLSKIYNKLDFYNPSLSVINLYFNKENQLKTMLLSINVPVIIMLSLYMFMLCRLIVNSEKNEIALLNSRGAKRRQIVLVYMIPGIFLGMIAFLLGPYIGFLLGKILGASSGFLEFVNRRSITTHISKDVYLYSLSAVLVFFAILFVPVFTASKASITDHKRSISRRNRRPIWQKSFIDVLLIIISIYGYYSFLQRQEVLKVSGASAAEISVNPLLFFVPPLFIIGTFLFFLRIYPVIINQVFRIGRRRWSPPVYNVLAQVGRSNENYHFLMMFITMTLSVGIFSATAARTLNFNSEEKIEYKSGADIVLTTRWEKDAALPVTQAGKDKNTKDGSNAVQPAQYEEPPFTPYTELEGVQQAAKVFKKNDIYVTTAGNKSAKGVSLMGIESYDFGNAIWFKSGLLHYPINEYLNLLSQYPGGCLISESLSKGNNVKAGDQIAISWAGTPEVDLTVMAVVEYWPSFNPTKQATQDSTEPMLVIANLPYIQNHMSLEPYEVWLKLKPNATIKALYDSIEQKKLPIMDIKNTRQEIIDMRTSPFMLAINGALTLGFVLCGLVCFLGFLLYWILQMNSRMLQFGIFSAIGLRLKNLISMIIWEQILTSGIAIAGGAVIGFIASNVFVPFFQTSFDASQQVPPFQVVTYPGDIIKIFVLVGFTMLLVLGILSYFIYTLKIDQAIKLGEE